MYEYEIIHETDLVILQETINHYAKTGWRLVQLLELKKSELWGHMDIVVAVMEKQKVQVFE